MRILRIEPGFDTNHSNRMTVGFYVLTKGYPEIPFLSKIQECNNYELKHKAEYCPDCSDYYNLDCPNWVLDEKTLNRIKTKIYSLVGIWESVDTFEIPEYYGDDLVRDAKADLKIYILKNPDSEIVGSVANWGEGGIESLSIKWVDDWLKWRVMYYVYLLVRGEINLEKLNNQFYKGGFYNDCLFTDGLDDSHWKKLRAKLSTQQLKNIEENKLSLVRLCGYSCKEKVEPRVDRAKKKVLFGLQKIKDTNQVVQILGGKIYAHGQQWELSQKELSKIK